MRTIKELISRERLQFQVFLSLSFVIIVLTGIIYFNDNQPFERFIGGFNPLLAGLLIIILGNILFTFLLSRGWFAIYKMENRKGLYRSAGLAAVLGLIMILADLKIVFPADTNILFPGVIVVLPGHRVFCGDPVSCSAAYHTINYA